jgi:hypothetical protein
VAIVPSVAVAKVVGLKPASPETMRRRIMEAQQWLAGLKVAVINMSLKD